MDLRKHMSNIVEEARLVSMEAAVLSARTESLMNSMKDFVADVDSRSGHLDHAMEIHDLHPEDGLRKLLEVLRGQADRG